MNDSHSIESRFEGHEIIEAGMAQIPNMLIEYYERLGLSDGHYTLLSHILHRKWTKAAPYPTISGIRMSANEDTRRRYVRDLRRKGLLFTSRLYWTRADTEEYSIAVPGRVRSNLWYLGSLFHNLVRIDKWLKAGRPEEEFQIEVPLTTVKMFLEGKFHDTPEEVAQAINEQTKGGAVLKAVLLVCENHTVEPSMRKTSTRKTSTRKTHSLKEESDTKKKQPNNKNQIAAASAAAASQPVSEKGRGKPGPIQEPSTSPENNHLQEDSATPYPPPRPEPVEGAAGPPDNDLAFSQVCRLYQAEIGKMSPLIAEEIRDRLRRCPPAWFEQAISKAAAAEARRWNYIKSILAAWEKCGGPENDHKPTRNGARNGKTSKQPTGNLNPANPDDWQKMLKSVAH